MPRPSLLRDGVRNRFASCAPSDSSKPKNYAFDFGIGLIEAQESQFFSDGSTASGGTKTGFAVTFDAKYYLSSRFALGAGLMYWSLSSSSDTLFGGLISYGTGKGGEVYLVAGKGFRLGYRQVFGNQTRNSGFSASLEFVAPQKDPVNTFAYIGIGYRL